MQIYTQFHYTITTNKYYNKATKNAIAAFFA